MCVKMLARYSWLRIRSVVGCCEHNNEHMGSLKIWELILQQTYGQLPNKASPSWTYESRLRVCQNLLVWIKH